MEILPEIFTILWNNLMLLMIPGTEVPILGLLVGCLVFAVAIHFLGDLLGFGDTERR